jgi:hypothetical protein
LVARNFYKFASITAFISYPNSKTIQAAPLIFSKPFNLTFLPLAVTRELGASTFNPAAV